MNYFLLKIFVPVAQAVRSVEELLPADKLAEDTESGVALPTKDFLYEIVPSIIKIILSLGGVVAFITFIVSGITLVVAQGNEEMVTKAKNIFIFSLVGLAFIVTAYAIIYGIARLFT